MPSRNPNPKIHIFQHITPEYGYAKYGGLKVVVRKADKWINITKLCAPLVRASDLTDFKVSRADDKYFEEVETPLVLANVQGIYVHPLIVPSITAWALPKFSGKIMKILQAKEEIRHQKREGTRLERLVFNMEREKAAKGGKTAWTDMVCGKLCGVKNEIQQWIKTLRKKVKKTQKKLKNAVNKQALEVAGL